jgi:hypothetical protein
MHKAYIHQYLLTQVLVYDLFVKYVIPIYFI